MARVHFHPILQRVLPPDSLRPVALSAFITFSDNNQLDDLQFHVVSKPGAWLDAAYDLMRQEFAVELLDPHERYVEWLEMNQRGAHPFPYILVVAYQVVGETAQVLGVLSGNVMPVFDYVRAPSERPVQLRQDDAHIFALGHQLTAEPLRVAGVRGLGTRLHQAGVAHAAKLIAQKGGKFRYSVLESERASVGFWSKLGYRWPQGSSYWQPPLEFDIEGRPLHPEAPETLMLVPENGEAATAGQIERSLLLDIVATLYLNWSLHKYRGVLSSDAMHQAETYVMDNLFGRVQAGIGGDPIVLEEPAISPVN